MDEKTTTDAPADAGGSQVISGVAVDDQGMAVAESQPDEQKPAEAVETTEPAPKDNEPSEPSTDDTSEWLKKKGIDPSDPDALTKVAKSAREAERAMHKNAQKASELEKTLQTSSDEVAEQTAQYTGQDPELLKRVQRVEVQSSVRDFFTANPEARELEADMIAEVQKRPYLAGDLDALYKVVKADNLDAVKSQAKKETLQNLAHNQQAAVPTGNAVTSQGGGAQKITPQNVDQMVAAMSPEEYRRRLPEINAAMAG